MIYPVFELIPDFSDPPEYGTLTAVERAGLSPAQDVAFFPHTQPEHTFSFQFVFTTAADIRAMKAFFLDRAGRTKPFYLPSWRNDLPAYTGAAGSNLLTVVADYELGDHADAAGRQVFIWQPGKALFVSSVVSATPGVSGRVELNLTRFLPFTVDATTAVIGYVHLVRFSEESLQYDHLSASVATVDAKFQTVRQWTGEEDSFSIERLDIATAGGTLRGFLTAEATVAEVSPADSRTAYANGPAALETGESYPMTTAWAAWINSDGIRLQEADPFDQSVPDAGGVLTNLVSGFIDTEHLSLCFNGATGWDSLAYQRTATAIRLWIKVFAGPLAINFDGLDPCLFNTGQLDGSITGEDAVIACYYRKPDSNRLYVRTTGDLFAAEHVAAVLPVRPVKLKRVFEDGATAKLEFLDASMRRVVLTSAAYPAFP